MKLPQIIYLVFFFTSFSFRLIKSTNKIIKKNDKDGCPPLNGYVGINVVGSVIASLAGLGILYWGGFFS